MPQGEGEKLPAEVLGFRLEVLHTVLAAGDPVERIDSYRALFERAGFSLTASSHMRQLLPLIALRQHEMDVTAVKGKRVSVIFDGTSHFGELLLIFVRYDNGEAFKQRLIRLRHSDSPLDTTTLSFILDRALHGAGIEGSSVVAFCKDTAAVNFSAVSALQSNAALTYGRALNFPCFSHTFNRIGKKLNLELAQGFIAAWSSYFSKTMKVSHPLSVFHSSFSSF